jgi:YfiH family protein
VDFQIVFKPLLITNKCHYLTPPIPIKPVFMRKHTTNGLLYYSFEIFAPYPLKHGVFTRHGPWGDPFNLSFEHGETLEVKKNLSLAEKALSLKEAAFVKQAHGDSILELDKLPHYHPLSPEEMLSGYDALISLKGRTLMIKLADCQGIILYDPQSGALALVHSGWRGSAFNILGKVVEHLKNFCGIDPSRLLAGVSPSIGPCCMEFKSWKEELPESLWKYRLPDSVYFDFWKLTVSQLTESGLKEDNIELSGICTKCNSDFFSHRRGDTGRFAVMAGL